MNYFFECISQSFDEHGIKATDEQIEAVADDVRISHENYGMAHGHDAIPNPLNADIENLKRQIKQLERDRDEAMLNFQKNVAMRRGCSPSDVEIQEDGHVIIH